MSTTKKVEWKETAGNFRECYAKAGNLRLAIIQGWSDGWRAFVGDDSVGDYSDLDAAKRACESKARDIFKQGLSELPEEE